MTQEVTATLASAHPEPSVAATFNKREIKTYMKLVDKFDRVRAQDESLRNRPELRSVYSNSWVDLVNFRVCDAAKPDENYVDDNGNDITHIYSYNKVMSL